MYDTDGDFGRVRLTIRSQYRYYEKYFDCITICGWHQCNDKYRINRTAIDNKMHLLLYTVSGKGEVIMNGSTYELVPGTAIIIKSGTAVSYYTPKNGLWEFYWIHFIGSPCSGILEFIAGQEKQLVNFKSDSIKALVEYTLRDKRGDSIQSIVKTSDMLSRVIHELVSYQDIVTAGQEGYGSITKSAVDFIRDHYGDDIGTADISSHLYVSCEHLIRTFKKETGLTPYAYLSKFRIGKAKELISSTNISIGKISVLTGFGSHSNFSKQFKAETGLSPGEYRKNKIK